MIKNYLVKWTISLTCLLIVCAESNNCPASYWPCKNGQCIRNEEVCDGAIHCIDSSDETVQQCLLTPCPRYAFQCAYGGCIPGNFKCNGIRDCADGSDETRYVCNTKLDLLSEIQGTCQLPLTMQCNSGECLDSIKLCDGLKDCQDGSDETVELCSFNKCPHYSFRCGYGACIAGTAKCNRITDCIDGSDELPNVCVLGYWPSVNYTQPSNTSTQLFPIHPIDTATTLKPSMVSQPEIGCISSTFRHEIDDNNLGNSTYNCPLYYWACNSGQCIRNEEVCDGAIHCTDSSDETVEQCLLTPCPRYAFKCTYGACIAGSFKCNGIEDCADGSDENRYLCNTDLDFTEEIQGICKSNSSMECKSGECIDNVLVCDGSKDCSDGSDETVELCSSFVCPVYAFRCGYGACIASILKCNHINDCKDGSDELSIVCRKSCEPIMPTTITAIKPSISSETESLNTTLGITTERTQVVIKYCSSQTLKNGISTKTACFYNNISVSCYHSLRPGTRANVTCASGYIEKRSKMKRRNLTCGKDGVWNNKKAQCTPECGTLTAVQKNSTIKPWDISIFKRNYIGLYSPICSGVIVSPKVVLTAAKCVTNHGDDGYVTDHVFYHVIEGFYNTTYSQGDNLSVRVHNVSKISIKTSPKMEGLAVLILVNYFKFSNYLKPICLPNFENYQLLLPDSVLNIGRPYMRDSPNVYLEFLTANVDSENSTRLVNYVNVNRFLQFINSQIKYYKYVL